MCIRDRLAHHAPESAVAVALHLRHACHGQAGWIHAVDAGGDQDITHLHVRVGRHEAQVQLAGLATSICHAAQAVAQQLHRDGLLLVRQQRDFGGEREHPCHLSHHALVVDHRQAKLHAGLRAAVQHHLAAGAVARVVQDFSQHRFAGHVVARLQQLAQLRVLGTVELRLLQGLRGDDLLLAQVAHLLFQRRQRREIIAHAVQRVARQQRCHLQGVEHGADHLPHRRQRVHA